MSHFKFTLGNRVRYVRGQRDDWVGRDATITGARVEFGEYKYDVEFDKPHSGGHTRGLSIPEASLEYFIVIDPKRPVQTTENPPRECRTIGLLERIEGTITILLSVPWNVYDGMPQRAPAEIEIDLNGKVINGVIGNGLTFMNVPKVDRGFYPLTPKQASPFGRGLISLDMCKSDYPESTHFVEFISVDGVPTEAKIHAR